MTKEIIEKYIQFAIDNGYNKLPTMEDGWYFINNNTLTITSEGEGIVEFEGNIIEIIISKEFIEAVARGLQKDRSKLKKYIDKNNFGFEVRNRFFKNDILVDIEYLPYTKEQEKGFEKIGELYKIDFDINSLINQLTIKQAFAIRDGKLEEFINNLLPKE